MRPTLVFAGLATALVLLAAVAIALMISIAGERTSWILVTVFALDSAALVLLAARATLGRAANQTRNGNPMPH